MSEHSEKDTRDEPPNMVSPTGAPLYGCIHGVGSKPCQKCHAADRSRSAVPREEG